MADAIQATYVKMATLVDGTMRVVLDVEPSAAADAFRLLGSPGTPIAVARLTNEAAQAATGPLSQTREGERKPLSLPQKVALTCERGDFRRYLEERFSRRWSAEQGDAAEIVRQILNVNSRAEITEGSGASYRWRDLEADFHDWQRRAA
ncbi:hypothetical protein J2X36_002110 [Methylobacterium sp. BE186]|uniref:hypothetical protein n=1 Tax=Methylobacterium sp. BE186 TaxID=2817715 RepID=UPI0028631766|nr:hypothetical protein [Methylobacterium sp. BE186]MDR7037363.1 hypothetical protein [Methylobacterium sp. BE186]